MAASLVDKIIRTKRRTLALQVTREGQVIVRAPRTVSQKVISDFVLKHSDWIIKKRDGALLLLKSNLSRRFADGETFYFLGKAYGLTLIEGKSTEIHFDGGFYLTKSLQKQARSRFIDWYSRKALEIIGERARHYASITGLNYNRLRITGANSRWGSCGANNNIRFSWRLVMAPLEIIDYVVVHELVHIRIKNHSKEFWDTVGTTYPAYRQCRIWLKENGRKLEI